MSINNTVRLGGHQLDGMRLKQSLRVYASLGQRIDSLWARGVRVIQAQFDWLDWLAALSDSTQHRHTQTLPPASGEKMEVWHSSATPEPGAGQ